MGIFKNIKQKDGASLKYKIEFRHDELVLVPLTRLSKRKKTVQYFTTLPRKCESTILLIDGDDKKEIGFGTSLCQPEDNYSKETGRAIALANAFAASSLDTETINQLIEAYVERKEVISTDDWKYINDMVKVARLKTVN